MKNFIESLKKSLEEIKLPTVDITKNFSEVDYKKILAVAVTLFVIAVGFFIVNSNSPQNISTDEKHIKFKIIEGMNAEEIARRLEKAGVIESAFKFRILARLNGYEDQLKIGTYNLTKNMNYDELFKQFLAGAPEYVKVTIPEGFTVKDIARRLYNEGLVDYDNFLRKAESFAPYDYIQRDQRTFYYCEGFLFPDTYEFSTDMTADEILYMLADNFDYRLSQSMRQRAAEENLSVYELITLASIVEKEVRFAEDRPIVAQVFFKRLKIGMPLQTDASLQYLMDSPKEDVSIADTQIDWPYNTYQHSGLPPGPIANPGLDAIEAVLNPASTDYLYFVADRSGHNHYAYSYDEHLNLVNQYR